MSTLTKLKELQNRRELADFLGYELRSFVYILYKMPEDEKYKTFEIPKKHGGVRTINAPDLRLSLIQKRLARMLYACVEEHKKENPRFWFASHGFQKKRTIVSNAHVHRRKRFVFNLDLEDFFWHD